MGDGQSGMRTAIPIVLRKILTGGSGRSQARVRSLSGAGVAVMVIVAFAFLTSGAQATPNVFSFDLLRQGDAQGPENYAFTAGNVIFPQAGVDAGRYYKFAVTDPAGAVRNPSFPCTPAANFATTNNSYTVAAGDPVSTGTTWKYRLNQYNTATCSGSAAKTTVKNFYVAKATAYADPGLTATKSNFTAGQTAYVVVQGAPPGNDFTTTWVLPFGGTACANTAGTDRPEPSGSGRVPNGASAYLQYRPLLTNTGSVWNRESNYEVRPCVAIGSTNEGAWKLTLQSAVTRVVTVAAFTVDTQAPPSPAINSGPPDPSNSTSASFAFSDSEPGVSFSCRLDGAAFSACSSPKSYTGLAQGSHSFQVKAQDAAGNESAPTTRTWTVDTQAPPTPTITAGPPDPSNSTSASFTFSDSEQGVSFRCQLDGAGFGACNSPQSYSGLAEGSHSFQVKARDAAGNESAPTTRSWTVDTQAPPSPTIDSGPPNPSNSTSASFAFSDSEPGVSFRCQLDGAGFAACSSPQAYSGLIEGAHSFQVEARDAAGNESGPATHSWQVSLAPIVTLNTPVDGAITADSTPTYSGTAGTRIGDSTVVTVKVYSGPTADGTPVQTLAALVSPSDGSFSADGIDLLPDGLFTARAEQSDNNGATGFSAPHSFTVDTQPPPTPTIDSGPTDPSTSTSASFAFSDSEPGASFRCQLDGAGFVACSSPKSYSGLTEGSHSFEVSARDAAGNESPSATRTWTVDTLAPPTPTIDSGPTDPSTSTSASFAFSDSEPGISFRCQLDGAGFGACSSPQDYTGLAQGSHSFQVKARDSAGNESGSASHVWTVDSVAPPTPTIDSGPTDPSNSTSASLAFSDSEAGVSFRCQLDGAGFSACSSPQVYTGLAEGSHSFQVKAQDAAGNESGSASHVWTIDMTTLPPPTIDSGPPDASNSTSASFAFSHSEPGVSFRCQLDGAGFSACSSPQDYAGLTQGSHSFQVKARNAAGNESTPATRTWTVDTVAPPTPAIDSGPSDPSNATSASFTFSDSESGVTFRCQLDVAAYSACTSPQSYSGLTEGTHSFQLKAQDAAGNESLATHSWRIDTAAPAVTLETPQNNTTTNDTTPSFAGIAGTAAGDASSITLKIYVGGTPTGTPVQTLTAVPTGSNWSVDASSALSDGTYTAQAEQADSAGNVGRSSPSTFRIDATAPTVVLTAPAHGASLRPALPTFAGTGGIAQGDGTTVTVRLYAGPTPTGSPIQTMIPTVQASGSFSVAALGALIPGTYTAQVEQGDAAGNRGLSAANTFTITGYPEEINADAPAGYWRLGEATGTTAADETATHNNGTYQNGVILGVPGGLATSPNTAARFDAVNDRVSMGDPANGSLDFGTSDFSVEAWVKTTANGDETVVSKQPTSTGPYWHVTISDDPGQVGQVRATISAGTVVRVVYGPTRVDDGQWHQIVVVFARATGITIYVDGNSSRFTSGATTATVSNTGPFQIGTRVDYAYFNGDIDELSVFGRALSAQQVQAHFEKGTGGDRTPPTVSLTLPEPDAFVEDTTPTFSGMSSRGPGDSTAVQVKIYEGETTDGSPVATARATQDWGGAWAVDVSTLLLPGTYTARAEQNDGAGNIGFSSPVTFTVEAPPPPGPTDPVVLAAGDIVDCWGTGDEATAALLDQFPNAIVATVGDHVYEEGSPQEFAQCYQPSWGRAKARTRPAVGDHEYRTPNAAGYFNYFHDQLAPFGPAATDPTKGWYSYDLGSWHVLALERYVVRAVWGLRRRFRRGAVHPQRPRRASGCVHARGRPRSAFQLRPGPRRGRGDDGRSGMRSTTSAWTWS